MRYDWYPHRFADIILNSDYALKQEIERVIQSVSFDDVLASHVRCALRTFLSFPSSCLGTSSGGVPTYPNR